MADELKESGGLKEVLASEILAKIEKGESVKCDHVVIKQDLNLSNLSLPEKDDRKLVTAAIEITDSAIYGSLDFQNSIFQDRIDFHSTRFFKDVNFGRSIFKYGPWFFRARFEKSAIFEKIEYNPTTVWERMLSLDFSGSLFKGRVSFSEAIIQDRGDFSGAGFFGHTDFHKAYFGELSLSNTGILDYIDINDLNTNYLYLYNAFFRNPYSQQRAFRKAKIIADACGDKDGADYCHFKEMEGKRIANSIPLEVLYDWDEVTGRELENRVRFPRNGRELFSSLINAIKDRRWAHLGDFYKT